MIKTFEIFQIYLFSFFSASWLVRYVLPGVSMPGLCFPLDLGSVETGTKLGVEASLQPESEHL